MKRQNMDERAWTSKQDDPIQLPYGLINNRATLLATRKIT